MKSKHYCEETNLQRIINFKLPHYTKKIGWVLFIISFMALLSLKFFDGDWTIVKPILKKLILASLFIVVLAREKVEDERVQHMRAKAFSGTFLLTAVYILAQPLVNFIVASILGEEQKLFEDLGDFVILWFMLIVYLMFFYVVKRKDQ